MKTVTYNIPRQDPLSVGPEFPQVCLYCGGEPAGNVDTIREKVQLRLPYCEEHLAGAEDYTNRLVKKLDSFTIVINLIVTAVVTGLIFLLVLTTASVFFQVIGGLAALLFAFFIAAPAIVKPLTKALFQKQITKLGFEYPEAGYYFEAPGLYMVNVYPRKDAPGSLDLDLRIIDDDIAGRFPILESGGIDKA